MLDRLDGPGLLDRLLQYVAAPTTSTNSRPSRVKVIRPAIKDDGNTPVPSIAPSGQVELHGLQMLRAVAASMVLLHHTLEESNGAKASFSPDWLTVAGASGVDIFFVISGFIMFYTSFRAGQCPMRPSTFLLRRATRIYPLYWICCIGMVGILQLGFLKNHNLTPSEIFQSFALLPGQNALITVSWTLVYEAYFYAIFAVTLVFGSVFISAFGTTAAIAAGWAFGHWVSPGPDRAFLTNPIAFEFAAGLWLGVAFTMTKAARKRGIISFAWTIPGLFLIASAPIFVPHATTAGLQGWSRVLAWGLPSTVIVAAFLSKTSPRDTIQRLLVFLGDASYSLYLSHVFVMACYGFILRFEIVSRTPQIIVAPIVVVVAIQVGVIVHVVIERPLSRAFRQRAGREQIRSEGR